VVFSASGDDGRRLPELPAQSARAVCGIVGTIWRRTSRLEDQNDKKKSRHSLAARSILGGVKVQRWLDDAPLMIDKP
jgi:hypothetical protein